MANASPSVSSSHQNIPELNDSKGDIRVTEWRKRLVAYADTLAGKTGIKLLQGIDDSPDDATDYDKATLTQQMVDVFKRGSAKFNAKAHWSNTGGTFVRMTMDGVFQYKITRLSPLYVFGVDWVAAQAWSDCGTRALRG